MSTIMAFAPTAQVRKPATPTFMATMAKRTATSAPAQPFPTILLKDCLSFIEDMKETLQESACRAMSNTNDFGAQEQDKDITRAEDLIEWIKKTQAANGGAS